VTELINKGKYLEIMFNTMGQPVGAQITNYLLEKVSTERLLELMVESSRWSDSG